VGGSGHACPPPPCSTAAPCPRSRWWRRSSRWRGPSGCGSTSPPAPRGTNTTASDGPQVGLSAGLHLWQAGCLSMRRYETSSNWVNPVLTVFLAPGPRSLNNFARHHLAFSIPVTGDRIVLLSLLSPLNFQSCSEFGIHIMLLGIICPACWLCKRRPISFRPLAQRISTSSRRPMGPPSSPAVPFSPVCPPVGACVRAHVHVCLCARVCACALSPPLAPPLPLPPQTATTSGPPSRPTVCHLPQSRPVSR